MAMKYNKETGMYEETLPGGQIAKWYNQEQAKKQFDEEQAKTASDSAEFQKEQGLIGQATQAGYGLADAYQTGSKQLGKATQEQGTAMSQMAARSLMAATPFGSTGGALLPAAAGTGIQALMSKANLERQTAKDQTGMQAMSKDALQAAAQFGISALPGNMEQNESMGYMKTFYEIGEGAGLEAAMDQMNVMLQSETNPRVKQSVQNMMNSAVSA